MQLEKAVRSGFLKRNVEILKKLEDSVQAPNFS